MSNRIIWTASRVEAMLAEKNDLRAKVAELEARKRWYIHRQRIIEATEEFCSCGGSDPADQACGACLVYHMLDLGEEVGDHE